MPNEGLTSRTIHGLKWSYVSMAVNSVLQIGFTAFMARLLDPKAFGLVAMAGVILRFGSYIAQMGIGPALIQRKEITKEDIRAAFTSSLLLGFLFFGLVWIAAPFALYIFDVADLILIIRVMAVSFVFTGLSTTAMSLLRRDLKFRSLAIIEIVSYSLGYGGVGVSLAYRGFGVWSLVISSLSQGALSAILSYIFSRHNISLIYQWKYYKQLYSFGGRVSFISFLEFIGSQLDKLAIGHFLGASALGIYDRAFLTANLPISSFSTSVSKVLFPIFSRLQTEIERLRKSYLATIMLVAAVIVPTCLGISAASNEIVKVLLGDKWIEAVPVLRILSIAAAFNFLSLFGGILCDATATLNVKIVIQLGYVSYLVIAFYLVAPLGLIGYAIAVAFGEFIRHSAYVVVTKRVFKTRAKELLSFYVPALTAGVIVGAVIYAVSLFARQAQLGVVFSLAVEMSFGFVILIYFFFFNRRQPIQKEIVARITSSGILSNRASATANILRWFCRRSMAT